MLSDYAIWLREHAGWSFTVFYDTFDGAQFIGGITMTLALCVICIGASLVTGYALYLLESVAKGGWSRFNDGFVAVFRNTPPLCADLSFLFRVGGLPQSRIAADIGGRHDAGRVLVGHRHLPVRGRLSFGSVARRKGGGAAHNLRGG